MFAMRVFIPPTRFASVTRRILRSTAGVGLTVAPTMAMILGMLLGPGIAGTTAALAAPTPPPAPAEPAPPTATQPFEPLPSGAEASSPAATTPPPATEPMPTGPAAQAPTVALDVAPAVPALQEPDPPIFEKWWFWTAIGAFAVTAVVVIASSSGPTPPRTDLGNMTAF